MTLSRQDRKILKSVSRSFYLSIRFVPAKVRTPIAIAYLLARTSDTIADTESVAVDTRLRRLADFEGLVRGIPSAHGLAAIQRDIVPEHQGERALIAALPRILDSFSALDMWDWNEISLLMANIIRGQGNDLETFSTHEQIVALPNAAALDDYTYLVAGCVGEWWTRLCYHHLPGYAAVPEAELTPLAGSFGKALQLVNILRDLPADLRAGRCYLPAEELAEHGVSPAELLHDPSRAQPVLERWLQEARALLQHGRIYIASVRVKRVKLACFLPWRLAEDTLNLLEARSPLRSEAKLKVPRSAVRAAFWEGIRVAFLRRAF